MTKIVDPLGIVNNQQSTLVTAKTVTSRFDHGASLEDCPVCLSEGRSESRMKVLSCDGIEAYTCLEHCVCLPVENH
jgi:hypothetical protein